MCAMLLQDYEAERLSQQDSAAVRQQERFHDDLTLGLSGTEATGLHHQGGSARMVCCNSCHLSHVCLHTDSKQKI